MSPGPDTCLMTQITTGLRSILNLPGAYDLLMVALGANRLYRVLIDTYVAPREHDRILDVGCGTGTIVGFLPRGVAYVGVDLSPDYIAAANDRFGDRAEFYVGDVSTLRFGPDDRFDIALAVGLLHHLEDREVEALLLSVRGQLKANGRLITIDNCFTDDQSPIARTLIRQDRGRNVRAPGEYEKFFLGVFDSVSSDVRHDLLRVPYTHVVITAAAS